MAATQPISPLPCTKSSKHGQITGMGMGMGEFDLIARFFTRPTRHAVLGVGDDCALLAPRTGMQMAISTDMLVAGRHFFADTEPRALGHKALAVNLSDLAACGAKPLAFTLALALPQVDAAWLEPFSQGLYALADAHQCELIGGDTTQGALTMCITVFGEVPPNQALLRSGAQVGDDIYVSGTLGGAALALQARRGHVALSAEDMAAACLRMDAPTPRVALGLALRGIASAAADISDGLVGDLGHILTRSGVGATLDTQAVERTMHPLAHPLPPTIDQLPLLLAGGDDYELVFTAPQTLRAAVQVAASTAATAVTRIGYIEAQRGLRLQQPDGLTIANPYTAYDHFT